MNNKGITLIALVITIIVLLILAGVSIAMLTGSNGILTQANTAKSDTAKAEIVERINMELSAAYAQVMDGKTTFSETELTTIENNTDNKVDATFVSPTLTIRGTDSYTGVYGTLNVTTGEVEYAK